MYTSVRECPFCGSSARAHEDTSSDYQRHWDWYVLCNNRDCWAEGEHRKTEDEAIAFWNSRPIEDDLRRRVAQLEHELLVGKIRGDIAIGAT